MFGRIHIPDRRDRDFALPEKRSKRQYRYWPDHFWTGDQGDSPHCVGFAWAAWLAGAPLRQFVNPDGLYRLTQPYDGEITPHDGTTVRAAAKVLQELGFISEYRWAFTLRALVSTVLERGPVVVGTDWYEGMEDGNQPLKVEGEYLGGHAYLISGANKKRREFRIKNSWGEFWGDKGHAQIGFDDMEQLLQADGEACLAVEARPA